MLRIISKIIKKDDFDLLKVKKKKPSKFYVDETNEFWMTTINY